MGPGGRRFESCLPDIAHHSFSDGGLFFRRNPTSIHYVYLATSLIWVVRTENPSKVVFSGYIGQLSIDIAYGDLLPVGKVVKVQALKNEGMHISFTGDGVYDAVAVVLADAGKAMGGLGYDAAIETADIVIQNDQPFKIVAAIKIGKVTRQIVWQNITIAIVISITELVLAAGGIAILWESAIADLDVAL